MRPLITNQDLTPTVRSVEESLVPMYFCFRGLIAKSDAPEGQFIRSAITEALAEGYTNQPRTVHFTPIVLKLLKKTE